MFSVRLSKVREELKHWHRPAIWIFLIALLLRSLRHIVWTVPDGANDERIWQTRHSILTAMGQSSLRNSLE